MRLNGFFPVHIPYSLRLAAPHAQAALCSKFEEMPTEYLIGGAVLVGLLVVGFIIRSAAPPAATAAAAAD